MLNAYLAKTFLKLPIAGTPYTLTGASEAARHTGFYIQELGFKLDAGVPTDNIGKYTFITHGHWDHVRELPTDFLEPNKECPPTVFVPAASTVTITSFVSSALSMTKHRTVMPTWNLISATYTDYQYVNVKNTRFKVEPFKCTHSCPTIGYGFIEIRSKLKMQHVGKSQEELGTLKKSGVEISEDREFPLFCFLGDTDHKVLSNEYHKLKKYPVIIVECTFLEPVDKRKAKKHNHMHWENLMPFVVSHPHINFVLCHFSCKYCKYVDGIHYVSKFFNKTGLTNVTPFVNRHMSKDVKSPERTACVDADSDACSCDDSCDESKDVFSSTADADSDESEMPKFVPDVS